MHHSFISPEVTTLIENLYCVSLECQWMSENPTVDLQIQYTSSMFIRDFPPMSPTKTYQTDHYLSHYLSLCMNIRDQPCTLKTDGNYLYHTTEVFSLCLKAYILPFDGKRSSGGTKRKAGKS